MQAQAAERCMHAASVEASSPAAEHQQEILALQDATTALREQLEEKKTELQVSHSVLATQQTRADGTYDIACKVLQVP